MNNQNTNIVISTKGIIAIIIIMIVLIGGALLYSGLTTERDPDFVVNHRVDIESGIVTFEVDADHCFAHIYMGERSWWNPPSYNDATREVAFCALDIPVGKIQFLTIYCKENIGDKLITKQMNFEVLRQSDTEIIITAYVAEADRPWYDFSYKVNIPDVELH